MKLVDCTVAKFLNSPTSRFERVTSMSQVLVYPTGSLNKQGGDGSDSITVVDGSGLTIRESILDGATIHNYEFAPRRW
jgi:hypothetical protein